MALLSSRFGAGWMLAGRTAYVETAAAVAAKIVPNMAAHYTLLRPLDMELSVRDLQKKLYGNQTEINRYWQNNFFSFWKTFKMFSFLCISYPGLQDDPKTFLAKGHCIVKGQNIYPKKLSAKNFEIWSFPFCHHFSRFLSVTGHYF
jgi:hypothetical protein